MAATSGTVRNTVYHTRSYLAGKYTESRSAVTGAVLIAVLVVVAIVGPILSPYAPQTMDTSAPLHGPSLAHPFGTDNFGRDILSRLVYGYRISLGVALGSVGLSLLLGVSIGLAAGYVGGIVDDLLMRPLDVLMSFPAIVLVVVMAGLFGQNTGVMILAIAVVYTPIIVRVMRGSTLEVKQNLFIEGARARGASELRIMLRHVLPNALSPALVQASILMGIAILIESALSFIGLGTQPPTPSLGLMLSEGRAFMREAPWMVVFPGLAIAIAVTGFNLLGDGLRELLDPARSAS